MAKTRTAEKKPAKVDITPGGLVKHGKEIQGTFHNGKKTIKTDWRLQYAELVDRERDVDDPEKPGKRKKELYTHYVGYIFHKKFLYVVLSTDRFEYLLEKLSYFASKDFDSICPQAKKSNEIIEISEIIEESITEETEDEE